MQVYVRESTSVCNQRLIRSHFLSPGARVFGRSRLSPCHKTLGKHAGGESLFSSPSLGQLVTFSLQSSQQPSHKIYLYKAHSVYFLLMNKK